MTWLNTSVHSGFARSASEAMFPRLFPDSCWLCPSLNPAFGGTKIWDLRSNNWGTLTNMTNDDWVVSGGKYALDFDGSNDFVSSTIPSLTGFITLSAWVRGIPGSGSSSYFVSCPNASGSNCIDFINPTNAGTNIVLAGGSLRTLSSGIDTRGVWTHLCSGVDGTRAFLFVNGALVGSSATTLGVNGTALRQINLGRFSSIGLHTACQLDDVRLYSRGLTEAEVRQLYQVGRGNMPLRRRRRYTEQAAGFRAYWARNNSRLIGAGNVS